jgi:transposase
MPTTGDQRMSTRKKYPKEFKLDADSLVLDQGYTRIEAARSLEN